MNRDIDLTMFQLFFFSMVALGTKLFEAGAGVHQWNLKRRDLNNILYVRR